MFRRGVIYLERLFRMIKEQGLYFKDIVCIVRERGFHV